VISFEDCGRSEYRSGVGRVETPAMEEGGCGDGIVVLRSEVIKEDLRYLLESI
jgi:hypothetical protein